MKAAIYARKSTRQENVAEEAKLRWADPRGCRRQRASGGTHGSESRSGAPGLIAFADKLPLAGPPRRG